MPRKFDDIDYRIIKVLQEKGRISNLDLSREVGLTPAPTLGRVRNLEKQRVIEGYHAQVNLTKLGITVKALIQVTLHQHKGVNIRDFIDAIMEIPEVVDCYQVTGDYDYLLRVYSSSVEDLDRLITQSISKIPEVGLIKSHIILSHIKHSRVVPNLIKD
ncbi:MAG: Lrp/AsnC family transcriptional regulator [Salibacteraceae bacterium]